MSNALRKTLAVFLCLTMCLSLFPAAGFAEDYPEEEILLEDDYTDEPVFSSMEEVVIEEKAVEEEILEEDLSIEGSGFELPIVRRLVEMMNGGIQVSSEKR